MSYSMCLNMCMLNCLPKPYFPTVIYSVSHSAFQSTLTHIRGPGADHCLNFVNQRKPWSPIIMLEQEHSQLLWAWLEQEAVSLNGHHKWGRQVNSRFSLIFWLWNNNIVIINTIIIKQLSATKYDFLQSTAAQKQSFFPPHFTFHRSVMVVGASRGGNPRIWCWALAVRSWRGRHFRALLAQEIPESAQNHQQTKGVSTGITPVKTQVWESLLQRMTFECPIEVLRESWWVRNGRQDFEELLNPKDAPIWTGRRTVGFRFDLDKLGYVLGTPSLLEPEVFLQEWGYTKDK